MAIRLSLLLLLLLLPSGRAAAQSVTRLQGFVYDAVDGHPVIGAQVALEATAYRTVTGNFGEFAFRYIPPRSYRVTVMADGFAEYAGETVDLVEDATVRLTVTLDYPVYPVEGITVVGKQTPLVGDAVTVIEASEFRAQHHTSIADVLESVPGVYIQRSGSGSGASQVSIRGAQPKRVLVLVDGQKVNPSANGVVDLNTIPIDMVERIKVHKGGASAEFGPDALGGVIEIITRRVVSHNFELDAHGGSGRWGLRSRQVAVVNPMSLPKISSRFSYSTRRADGDFDFRYSVAPRNRTYEGTRVNNGSDAYNYFGATAWKPSAAAVVKVSGQLFRLREGLPDRASAPNLFAFSEDRRRLLTARLDWEHGPAWQTDAQLGLSRFEQYHHDLENVSAADRFENKYTNDIYSGRAATTYRPTDRSEARFGVQFARDVLDHNDLYRPDLSMERSVRSSSAVFVSARQSVRLPDFAFFDEAGVDGALRFDHARTAKDSTSWRDPGRSHAVDQWSPKIGATLSVGHETSLILRASYGKSFRLPSINSLFWKGDVRSQGNPNLKPERAEHSEAGAELNLAAGPATIHCGATYFHSSTRDLVVWQAGYGGVWTPVNLDGALTTGHEEYVELRLYDRAVTLRYDNTITNARNRVPGHNSYDKELTFTPHYVTGLSARLRREVGRFDLYGSYAVRLVGRRYALESNDKWYEAYRIDDVACGFEADLFCGWRIGGDLKMNNIFEEDYVLMTHYPMPGRAWEFGLRATYEVSR